MNRTIGTILLLPLLSVLLIGCGDTNSSNVPTPPSAPEATLPSEVIEAIETLEPVLTAVPDTAAEAESAGFIQTREPEPTATPGVIYTEVERLFGQPERSGDFPITSAEWVNLFISLLMVALSYLLGTWLIYRLLARFVHGTEREFDDLLYQAIKSSLRWLVVILALRFATIRLSFLSVGMKTFLMDVYFVLFLLLTVRLTWRTIDVTENWYRARSVELGNEMQVAPVISWIVRMAHAFLILTAAVILLSHFGIDVFAFAAALGLTGFAISLAARDTIADVIAGMIIMVDRPFRVGDRIEIQGENTWGDVADIGLRTTRIRTRDNRLVIVPNSIIAPKGSEAVTRGKIRQRWNAISTFASVASPTVAVSSC